MGTISTARGTAGKGGPVGQLAWRPITETLKSGESHYECAVRGAGEEATPLLRQSMLDSSRRAELTRFNGTPVFVTEVSNEAVSMPFAPSQMPPHPHEYPGHG